MSMHVSWHAATHSSTLRDIVHRTLPATWRTLEQATPHTQFEHLASLVNDAINRGGPPQWVCFTDDDDLWSPRRSKLLTAECRDTGPSTHALLCRRKARPASSPRPGTSGAAGSSGGGDGATGRRSEEPSSAADVEAMLASGAAALCNSRRVDATLHDQTSPEAFHRAEYFDYVVRFEALAHFTRRAPPALLHHRLCDMGFTRWVRDNCTVRDFEPLASPREWVYWYGMALGNTSVSQGVQPVPQEYRLGKRALEAAKGVFSTEGAATGFLAVR